MKKVFLFEENKDIVNLIRNAIQNEFDDEVRSIHNLEEAIKEISMGDYDLLIVRDILNNVQENTKRFFDAVKSNNVESKIISIGEVDIEDEILVGQLPDKFNLSDLIKIITDSYSRDEDENKKAYIEIKMNVLELFENFSFDLYARMRRPGKSDQYIKKIKEKDGKPKLQELINKGTKSLFLEKQNRLHFTNDLVKEVTRKINIDFHDFEEIMISGEAVYRLARTMLSEQGTNEISYRLINCLADEMIGNLKKNRQNVANYIFSSIDHTTSYSYRHLNLIGIFCFISLPYLDLMEEKKEIFLQDFIYAAYFHDIILEEEGMAEIHTKTDWINCHFEEKEKNLIRDHAKLASELLSKFPGSSKESVQIVKEHHGVPSGVGFMDRKAGTLTGSSVFFDVIHDFVELFLNFPPDGSLDTMLQGLEESYSLPAYKQYASVLKKGIVETFKDET